MKRLVGWKGLKEAEDNDDQNFLQKLKTTMMDDHNFKKLKKDNDDHISIFSAATKCLRQLARGSVSKSIVRNFNISSKIIT